MTFDPSSAVPEQQFDPTTAVPEEAPPVRAVLSTAVKQNPDQAARAAALGKQYGMPTDVVVRNLQNVELQAIVDKADERLQTSPKLAAAMRKRPDIAPLAHDDIEPLAKIESNFAQVAAASLGQAVLGISEGIWRTPDVAQRAVGYLAGQVERTGLPQYLNPIRGVQDVLQFISEGRLPVGPKLFAGTTDVADKVNDAQKILGDRETFGNPFADVQTLAQNADKALATAIKTGNLQQAAQVLTDPNYWSAFMSQAIPSLYLAMKSGGSTAFMGWMEGMEQAGNAAEFEKKTGIKISDAEFTQAVAQTALVNALLEKYGLDKVLGAKGGGIKGILKAIFAEGGTEGLQQVNSNLSALLTYNPEQSLSEGVMASVMGGAGSGGGVSTAQAAAGRLQQIADKRKQQADAANTNSTHLAEQMKAAGTSALRERSPESFRALMGEMTDGKVYVDGAVLNQLPPEVQASLPPAVQEQIATAAATGDVVEIPVADVLTVAPGTPLEQVLVEHARTDPFAMSKADAEEATKLAQSSVLGEAQRLIEQAQDAEQRQAEYDQIHAVYAGQLNAAARFRPQVNDAKAHWLASFYTTMAARTGMTALEFQAAHPVRVLGEATAVGQQVMDQVPAPAGALVGEDGKPLMLYHGTNKDITKFKPGRGGGAIWFAADPKLANMFVAGGRRNMGDRPTKGSAVYPVYLTAKNPLDLGPTSPQDRLSVADVLRMAGLPSDDAALRAIAQANLDSGYAFVSPSQGDPVGYLARQYDTSGARASNTLDDPGLIAALQAAGYDGLKMREEGTTTYAVFDPKQIVSATSGQVLGQPTDARNLVALHNLTPENLLNADALGGLPVPSIGIGRVDAAFGGYGGITLIGGASMVDPATGVPVFDSDAYTARFPELVWKAVPTKKAQALIDKFRPVFKAADSANALDMVWDHLVNRPDKGRAVDEFERSTGGKLAYVQSLGETIDVPMRDVGLRHAWSADAQLNAWVGANREALADADNLPYDERMSAPAVRELSDQVAAAIDRYVEPLGDAAKADGLADGLKSGVMTDGVLNYGAFRAVLDDARKVGQKEVDRWELDKTLSAKLEGQRPAYEAWVKKQFDGLFPEPMIEVGRRKVPVTLDNIVEAMTRGGVAGKEKSMTYSTGKARAAMSKRYQSIAEIQADRQRVVSPEDHEAAKKAADDTLEQYRTLVIQSYSERNWRGDIDTWGALDASMRALGAIGKTKNPSDAKIGQALRKEGFVNFGSDTVDLARKAAATLRDTPVDYLEAKPQRAVMLNEFAGAVIPSDTPAEARAVLERNGIPAVEYEKGDETARRAAIESLSRKLDEETGGQVLMQGPRGTFNPATLELVLNPNANLSTFFHETGHFFLEVLADVASQPNAPQQISDDFAAFLKWAGVADAATWNAMTLDQKRPYHERWAESIEQYVMEGKAPSVELQPLMRRFAAWLKSVYGSIQKFLAQRGVSTGGEVLGQAPAPKGALADENGKPLVLYHVTNADIQKFDVSKSSKAAAFGPGVYLTEDPGNDKWRTGDGVNVMPVYGEFKNPLDLRRPLTPQARAAFSSLLGREVGETAPLLSLENRYGSVAQGAKAAGFDAILHYGPAEKKHILVLDPATLTSAISGEVLGQGNQPTPSNIQLNDDIRRVMDRLLATDAQIAQANEVAGLVPNEEADAAAAERLAKRSMADLKWAVRARDQVIAKLRKQAAAIEKDIREQVTVEVDQTPEMRAKRALDALTVTPEYAGLLAEHKAARKAAEGQAREEVKAALLAENPDAKGLVKGQLLAKNKRDIDNKVDAAMIKWDQANPAPKRPVNATDADVATIADSFGFESVDAMMQAIDAFGSRKDAIDGLTERRMLEEHGDLIDERAISEAANEAVHNEARARSLATELRTQREMLNPRQDTGEVNAKGRKITVNALVEAAKQFAANVVGKTALRDLTARAWQHTAAERRAAKRWADATAAGKTAEAVQAKQDQMLQNAAAKAAIEAKAEARKILEFFRRVTKGNDEAVVEKGRDPDVVNAARAVLAAYGVESPTSKTAAEYLKAVENYDPEMFKVLQPMVDAATQNAQPLDALTFDELQALNEEVQAMWFLAKRSRQMEVDGDLMDRDDLADELFARMEVIGIPDRVPGEGQAVTKAEERALMLRQGISFLRRVEQWAEGMDGKYGGPFLKYIFQPVKAAADRYRADRAEYRKKLQALVDNLAPIVGDQVIAAPELGYTFGAPGSARGTAMNEILHAIIHTGNDSNKRKLLLGRGWATENPDGTLDTARWDAFITRLVNEGKLQSAHYDFVQGVWDLLEETKPLAQKAHRDALGRYFAEVTADAFVDPWGQARRGGYAPAIVDAEQVKDNELRKLAESENENMTFAFPAPNKGFTKARVEYNRPLLLDLRSLAQHIDKVLLFSHMTVPARDVRKLITAKKVGQPLTRIDASVVSGMLQPWLQRSAQQVVEDPIVGAGKWARVPSVIRARAGAALMFANVSNAIQQVTGLLFGNVKVKARFIRRALAQHVAHPKKMAEAVWAASPYMNDRAKNEVAVMNEAMQDILLNPSVYERAQAWSMRNAYFLQTAIDNALSPIVWTGAYNQAMAQGMGHEEAVRFADGTVRQTQGSTLPEDVSRFETGPAYARAFTQFVGYFNVVANTNGTALKQIANEVGLKKGAGRALHVVMMGLLAPIWAAELIALAFKGGPDDEDKDGQLIDDWIAAVFGFGTVKGLLAMIPIAGQAANSAVTRLDNNPMNDRISLSPGLSLIESALGGNVQTVAEILDSDKDVNARRAVRDAATLVSVFTGLPLYAVARPLGYGAGVAQGKIEPTGPVDFARGLVTGTASPESKQR